MATQTKTAQTPTATAKPTVKKVTFCIRPNHQSNVSDLFGWREMLSPLVRHYKLKDEFIKTHFNLSEGFIRVTVSFMSKEEMKTLQDSIVRLLSKENDVWF